MKKKVVKEIGKKMWKWLNKTMEVKYMALYALLGIIVILVLIIVRIRTVSRFVWWTPEDGGVSNWCYDSKDGKYCLVPKHVNEFEKTKEELK